MLYNYSNMLIKHNLYFRKKRYSIKFFEGVRGNFFQKVPPRNIFRNPSPCVQGGKERGAVVREAVGEHAVEEVRE